MNNCISCGTQKQGPLVRQADWKCDYCKSAQAKTQCLYTQRMFKWSIREYCFKLIEKRKLEITVDQEESKYLLTMVDSEMPKTISKEITLDQFQSLRKM